LQTNAKFLGGMKYFC